MTALHFIVAIVVFYVGARLYVIIVDSVCFLFLNLAIVLLRLLTELSNKFLGKVA